MDALSEVFGLYKFLCQDDKVILEKNGEPICILDFINIMNDPRGKIRTKMKILEPTTEGIKEQAIDLFVKDIQIRNLGISILGEERTKKDPFNITFEFKLLQQQWTISGSIGSKSLYLCNKDIGQLANNFITYLRFN